MFYLHLVVLLPAPVEESLWQRFPYTVKETVVEVTEQHLGLRAITVYRDVTATTNGFTMQTVG